MSASSKNYMLTAMQRYFAKVKSLISSAEATGVGYVTNTLAANATVIIDAPTLMNFTASTHQIYSMDVSFRVNDPESTAPVKPVIDSYAMVDWAILPDGTLSVTNRYNGVITYHCRFGMPLKK